jgi:hypothetical protein
MSLQSALSYHPDHPTKTFLSSDRLDELCRHASLSEVKVVCETLSYDQLFQLHQELNSRIKTISGQFGRRPGVSSEWFEKATRAQKSLDAKRKVVDHRLASVRQAAIALLAPDNVVKTSRVAMIKSLLVIIDKYAGVAAKLQYEQMIIDAAREVTALTLDGEEFPELRYHSLNKSITDQSGAEIAWVERDDYEGEKIGIIMAASGLLLRIAHKGHEIAVAVAAHNDEPCSHCHSCPRCADLARAASLLIAESEPVLARLR